MIKIENTLKTSVTYNGTGTQTRFDFPFDYLRKSFVYVSVNNALMDNTTDYTIDGRTVVFNTAPASGSVIRIYRETATDRLVVWADASVLKAADMTIQQVQQLHILEETNDWTKSNSIVLNDEGTAWQGRNYRLSNISDPVDEQDAVTKRYIDNEENSFTATMNALKNQTEQTANQSSTNANNAKKSENAAKLSETNAKNSEIAAKYSEIAAKDSETNAKTSETIAKNSELGARTSANAAAVSRESARSAATTASNYASAARKSANEAQTYETSAQTYMNNAKNYSENVNVFIPSVSSSGVLSWTNRAGLDNPASVNIKGAKGDTGAQGAAGVAASIRIGSVITGEPYTNASVSNSGTASNVVLNFTLPRGKDGKDGGVTVDAELSDTSTNPIQNKVVKTAIDTVTASIPTKVSDLENDAGYLTQHQSLDGYAKEIVGTVIPYAGTSLPNGYLPCNGAAVSRETYADLFAVIGTTYGRGDGSTTFNLPNLTDKFIQGSDIAGTVKDAGLPNISGIIYVHTYKYASASGAFSSEIVDTNTHSGANSDYSYTKIFFNASDSNGIYGNSATVQPPSLTMRYIIKY